MKREFCALSALLPFEMAAWLKKMNEFQWCFATLRNAGENEEDDFQKKLSGFQQKQGKFLKEASTGFVCNQRQK
jgi:hypothetical protein